MQLVEKHLIRPSHSFHKELDDLCFSAKNLYNSMIYISRQYFEDHQKYIGFKNLYHGIKKFPIWDECGLAKKLRNQVVKLVDQNYRSYFAAFKEWKKDSSKFNGMPKPPNYKDSIKGRIPIFYDYQSIRQMAFKKRGTIGLTGSEIEIPTRLKNWKYIDQVRIVPKNKSYQIEVVYTVPDVEEKSGSKLAAIDLGVNNLATVSFSDGKKPFIVNGRPLKSINQFYNKTKIKFHKNNNSKTKWTRKLDKLTLKRNNKINDYIHKSSRLIVDQLVSRDVSKLIIGYNQNWKQDMNLGSKNNQNFKFIPFLTFILMLEYKCKLKGIQTMRTEESYTSKCSFLDSEEMRHHSNYAGRRIKRGLYKSACNRYINADLNGSYNIMRKVVPNLIEGIEGIAVCPRLITV